MDFFENHIGQCVVDAFYSYARSPEEQGRTFLHAAATVGHIELVKKLVTNIEDKNPRDRVGATPLHLAATFGHFEIIKFMSFT